MQSGKKYTSIDAYHADYPQDIRERLEQLREIIREVIPDAKGVISYNIPAFKVNRVVVF